LYVGDNNISHVDLQVVIEVIEITKKHFEELVIYCEKKHTFLVIDITINDDKTIKVQMKDQLNEAINTFFTSR